jgi:hypothetical protein
MYQRDYTIVRSDTWNINVAFNRNGIPIDLSGSVVYFTVKSDINDADSSAVISKTYADLTGSNVTITADSTDTTLLKYTKYHYDVVIRDIALDMSITILLGKLYVLNNVTERDNSDIVRIESTVNNTINNNNTMNEITDTWESPYHNGTFIRFTPDGGIVMCVKGTPVVLYDVYDLHGKVGNQLGYFRKTNRKIQSSR